MIQIKNLSLVNFRNFLNKKIEFSHNLILLFGANGVGKTNILESLTLFGRTTSLRGSDFEEMLLQNASEKEPQFHCLIELLNHEFIEKTSISFSLAGKKKSLKINDEPLSATRQKDVKNYFINFVSLTPKLEQLFISGKSSKREYLDKIVQDINPNHQSHINDYQKLLKERLLILQKYQNNNSLASQKWLETVETKIAELGVAIAFARVEAINFFNNAISAFSSKFPKATLVVNGEIEALTVTEKSVILEENYRQKLKDTRKQDLLSFKTSFGVHRSDFDAIFNDGKNKNISATLCSTGEQKAIMIGITLARAKISSSYKNQPTILIFDEVVAHLDEERKGNLFAEIIDSNLQSFFSATNSDLIPQDYLENHIQAINIS